MTTSFESLGLLAELVRAVAEEGYTQPTPVQAQAIPPILAGRDVLAGAQTGTGKTAGFALPMLQRLARHTHHGGRHAVRALVLTPTRELAMQVEESIRAYGRHMSLRSTVVYGGVGIQPQVDALAQGVDILVATPGRLLDHAGQKNVHFEHVEILVLDEADRMLDMGFIHDIRRVLALLPKERQNLLFSATYTDEIRELADTILRDPVEVAVARRSAESELVAQRVIACDQHRKRELLAQLVSEGDWHQVLVFTRTKHGANRLAEQLTRRGIEASAIHGNKSQGARIRALAGFKSGELRVLVATDIAARGLDIEELPHVVNYDLPNVPEDYVHRIGRTGRAGCTGEAISLVAPEERESLAAIEKLLRRKLEQTVIPGFEPGSVPPPPQSQQARQPQQGQPPRREQVPGPAQPQEGPDGEGRRRKRRRRGRGNRPEGAPGAPPEVQNVQPAFLADEPLPELDEDFDDDRQPAFLAAQAPTDSPPVNTAYDERQPDSNASSLFPSSWKFDQTGQRRRGNNQQRRKPRSGGKGQSQGGGQQARGPQGPQNRGAQGQPDRSGQQPQQNRGRRGRRGPVPALLKGPRGG